MCFKYQALASPNINAPTYTSEQMNINNGFQRLWIQMSVFTRSYIYAVMFNSPNAESEAGRLYKVPADFYSNFVTFYGPEIADKLDELLTNFLTGVLKVVEGEKTNNQALVNQGVQEWYKSADDLAKFLDSINLFWDINQWRNLLYQYIGLNLTMITAVATGNYQHAIQIYDNIFDIASIMGTYMAYGLFAQQLQKKV